jgi:hypothetical protein
MKRIIVLAVIISLITVLAFTMTSGATTDQGPRFTGAWWSIDFDGSYQTVHISGSGDNTYLVNYHDYGATACGCSPDGEILYGAIARGIFTADGNVLQGTFDLWCLSKPMTYCGVWPLTQFFTWDPSTDTIIGWNRMGTK